MISRPPKAIVWWTRCILLLALSVVLLGTARAAGTSASSCPLDKVLISNGDSILVDVRALGHCHQHADVADILKTASVRRSSGQVSMVSRLTQNRNDGPYRNSCRNGIWQSIRSSVDNSVVADMTMLICVCGLAGTFTTDIVQNGNILTDGNPRAEFEFEEWNVHQFNDDGTQMCKEFRRRAISNCMSHTIGNTEMGFCSIDRMSSRMVRRSVSTASRTLRTRLRADGFFLFGVLDRFFPWPLAFFLGTGSLASSLAGSVIGDRARGVNSVNSGTRSSFADRGRG